MIDQARQATKREGGIAREVSVIINLRSRSGAALARHALEELERQGVRVAQSHLVKSGSELMRSTREAIESGQSTIAVGGGDGTISSVINLFARRPELTLGLLPVGTGNETARSLGIPLDLPGACRVIASGRTTNVDLGEANGNYFLHTALVGSMAQANYSTPSWVKRRFGRAGYIYTLATALFGTSAFDVTVTTDHTRWSGRTSVIVVGNNRFFPPTRVLLPDVGPNHSGLVVFAPRNGHPLMALRVALGLWVLRRPLPSLLLSTVADSLTVETDPAQVVDLDGEYGRPTPIRFRLARGALRVLVPDRSGPEAP